MSEGLQRRLAAIVAADVAEYSRLVRADEEGTLRALRGHRHELTDPLIARYGGRIANTAGDSLLVEFPSAVEAVRCTLAVQAGMAKRNLGVAADRQIRFRIGINIGDVVAEGDDLLGDGVNVAARLENLAEPGGIYLSRTARDQVRDQLDLALEDLGEVEVKNLARPIRVFRVLPEGEEAPPQKKQISRKWILTATAAAVLVVAVAGGAWWWQPWVERVEPLDPAKLAFQLPEKPSIAVLPFNNLSGDSSQEYLSDGFTENLITTLSNLSGLLVIARNSTFTYKGKAVKIKQVAEELGVRYVLEGSLQRSGNQIRVNAQLIDAVTGYHIWADNYDRKLDDLLKLQDEIAWRIAIELSAKLTDGEMARRGLGTSIPPKAIELSFKALANFRRFEKLPNAEAIRQWTEAGKLGADPFWINLSLSWAHWVDLTIGWSEDPKRGFESMVTFAEKAMALDDSIADVHTLYGGIAMIRRQFDEAVEHGARAIALGPNNADVIAIHALLLRAAGHYDQAIAMLKRAMRLSPYYPDWYLGNLASSNYLAGNYAEAMSAYKAYSSRKPDAMWAHLALAASHWMLGEKSLAKDALGKVLEANPEFSMSDVQPGPPRKDMRTFETYKQTLRAIGLPDLPPSKRAAPERMKFKLPEKPSIAVLPFDNLSGDAAQDYIGDGLTENIIAVLATSPDLFVIARNSSFTYRGKPVQVQEVAERFGVRYVLEGSVQRSGDNLRVTAQLVDAIDGRLLWAERYDRKLKDIFALYDDITQQILLAMQVKLTIGEQARYWREAAGDPESYRLFVQGRARFQTFSREGHLDAEKLWTELFNRNPDAAIGNGLLGWVHLQKIWLGLSKSPETDLAKVRKYGEQSLSINEEGFNAHAVLAWVDVLELKFDSAIAHANRAAELSPTGGDANALAGSVKVYSGQPAEGVELLKRGMRYEPDHAHFMPLDLAYGLRMLGRFDESKAISNGLLESSVEDVRAQIWSLGNLAIISMWEHDETSARQYINRMLEIEPNANIARWKRSSYFTKDQAFVERSMAAARKAGLPEHPPGAKTD